ncbi:MAG: hypothetical protein HFI36_05065 [Bacilli bacterium]|jgi:hypothetical protein|nr:hypothetical protein [Bacilli bacterium]MCX4255056.1 hypothetical protein [Bacilli bacterium]
MGLKPNVIIVLENKEEYIVLNEAMYYGKKYFLGMKLNEKREVIPSNVVILEEYMSGFETYVSIVVDSELITVLTRMFKAQVETT